MLTMLMPASVLAETLSNALGETETGVAEDFISQDDYFDYEIRESGIVPSGAPFVWPLANVNARVESPFGFRRSSGRMHFGIDVMQPVGTPVYAAAAGTVRTSTREGAWGNLIVIEHDYPFNHLSTFYAHLHTREADIRPGVRVEAGQLIGTAGRTGNASASHLHFELRVNNMPVNPMTFFHANESRATYNPNPLFVNLGNGWEFNPDFDHTFTVHEYARHRQGNSTFLLPTGARSSVVQPVEDADDIAGDVADGDIDVIDEFGIPDDSEASDADDTSDTTDAPVQEEPDAQQPPMLPNEQAPAVIFDPHDLGLIPQTPDTIDSYAFGASLWAAGEIDDGIRMGIIPENLLYNFQENITRAEFAEAAVRAILVLGGAITDTDEDEFAEYVSMLIDEYDPFDDSDNVFVIIAHYLHIVNGVGERTFAPDNSITRQEAAAMLQRIAWAFGVEDAGGQEVSFADSGRFAPWAADSIEFVASAGIMGGIGNNEFSPAGAYTREQTFVTMSRLAGILEDMD
jgi:hypothetical protein